MESSSYLPIIQSYVPNLIVRRLAEKPEPITEATAERFPAAVLFADIAGFTQLAEQMARETDERVGAEALADLLNDYFHKVIEIIHAHGGDVVKFAGDALLALWSAPNMQTGFLSGSEEKLKVAAHQAAHCAWVLQAKLDKVQIGSQLLQVQIGICAGHVSAVHIGGVRGRWEFMLSGTPLVGATQAEEIAKPGQVVLSKSAWGFVADVAEGRPLQQGFYRLTKIARPTEQVNSSNIMNWQAHEEQLARYIPAAVLPHLRVGYHEWVAEIRQVTVLFIHLPSFGTSIKHPYNRTLPRAQKIMQALQAALYRYEGSINKLNVDDKGITLVAALGLPPLSHEDDPVRGVQAAVEMVTAVREFGRPIAIGVTTGHLFCGPIGHPQRREYTMVGDAMNLASRLMEAAQSTLAKKKGGLTPAILCDETTYLAAREQLGFDKLKPVHVKGKVEPVPIFRPLVRGGQAETKPSWQQKRPSSHKLIGREEEWSFIDEQLRLLRSGQPPSPNLFVLEGETGIGKSQLMVSVENRARRLRLYLLATTIEDNPQKVEPFNAWRPIFAQLFGLDRLVASAPQAKQAHVLQQLPVSPEERGYPLRALRMAPLLNEVLPIEVEDNELTRPLQGEARIRATQQLLLRLLPMMLKKIKKSSAATLLLFDNGHLMDEASFELAQAVANQLSPVMVMIGTKILPTPNYVRLQTAVSHTLRLGPLAPAHVQEMIRRQMGVKQVSEEVMALIAKHGEGHPFFSQTIISSLHHSGHIYIADNECHTNGFDGQFLLPAEIQKTIINSLDRLQPSQQLLLKTAASVGEQFTVDEVTAVHPIANHRQELHDDFQTLTTLGILQNDSAHQYRFTFQLGRHAVNQTLLTVQKNKLSL